MIPKHIYYVWVGGEKPPKIQECIDSWYELMPDYEITELNESNIDFSRCKLLQDAFDNQRWSYVADAAKVYSMQKHPGIYLDADMLFIKPIPDKMLDTDGAFFVCESPRTPCFGVIGIAHKNNPFVNTLVKFIDSYKLSDTHDDAFIVHKVRDELTNAGFFEMRDSGWADLFYDNSLIRVYSRDYFIPIPFSKTLDSDFTDNTIAVHRWTGTALTSDNFRDGYLKRVHKLERQAKKKGLMNYKNESQRIFDVMRELYRR